MSAVWTAILAFACALSGAAFGIAMRSRLPEHHFSRESTDVVKLATGLVATLVALVLSLLISSANNVRVSVENEYKVGQAQILELDRYLAAYGPEGAQARAALRDTFAKIFARRWPSDDFGVRSNSLMSHHNQLAEVERMILALHPVSSEQTWYRSQALRLTVTLARLYYIIMGQEIAAAPPWAVLFVVAICAAAIFASFGLYTAPNTTVLLSLVIAALAVASAMLLIVDLGDPFNGLLRISSAPAHATLNAMGK